MAASRNLPIPLRGGDEQDYLTGWHHYCHKKPGQRKAVKNRYWRRFRHNEKLHEGYDEAEYELELQESIPRELDAWDAYREEMAEGKDTA